MSNGVAAGPCKSLSTCACACTCALAPTSAHPSAPPRAGAHGYGSSTLVTGFEAMHNHDLGLFLYLVKASEARMRVIMPSAQRANSALAQLNHRMKRMLRADDFQLPKDYFPSPTNIQAKEHRNVMQVAPFLYDGIDNEMVELYAMCVWGRR